MEITIKLNGEDKNIIIGSITRKIDKEYNKKMMGEGTEVSNTGDIKMNPANILDAEDYKISALTGLSIDDIDSLDIKEYDKIVSSISKLASAPGSRPSKSDKK